jgi:hypothetical protein
LFGAGACASVIQGIIHLEHPKPIENPALSYVVLGLSRGLMDNCLPKLPVED